MYPSCLLRIQRRHSVKPRRCCRCRRRTQRRSPLMPPTKRNRLLPRRRPIRRRRKSARMCDKPGPARRLPSKAALRARPSRSPRLPMLAPAQRVRMCGLRSRRKRPQVPSSCRESVRGSSRTDVYSTVMPACRMTLPQRSDWLRMKAPNSSGRPPPGSSSMSAMRCRISGEANASLIS